MNKEALKERLFSNRTRTYCVLDGAAIPELPKRLYEYDPLYECLIRGELSPDMVHVAPYVALMVPNDKFSEWVLENGPGTNGVIFIQTRFSITEMRNHLRALMNVHSEDGRPMLFRFYDPRVFRKFLPTCDAEQTMDLFGKIDKFIVESGEGDVFTAYEHLEGVLKQSEIELGDSK